jgi:hypothetical protein
VPGSLPDLKLPTRKRARMTVEQLIEALQQFGGRLPVRIRNAHVEDSIWFHDIDDGLTLDENLGVIIDLGEIIQ